MRTILLIIALALPVLAGPDIDALARGLADEDPSVRGAARKELLSLDEDDAPALLAAAARSTDPEARAALREIAEIIADRRYIDCAKEFADAAARRGLELDDVRKWKVHPVSVFLCWVGEADRILLELDAPRDAFESDPRTISAADLRLAGFRWLRAWTLADIGDDEAAWRAFAARTRRNSWSGIRLAGLAQRGFKVLDADPEVVVAEFVAAWRPPKRFNAPGNRRTLTHGRGAGTESFLRLLRSAFGQNEGAPFPAPDVDAVLDWLEAGRNHFSREKNRFTSTAVADDFLDSLGAGRPGVQLAALEALKRWPERIPVSSWDLLSIDAEKVATVMALAKLPVPREKLVGLLEALPPWTKPEQFSGIWNEADLADLVTTREHQRARSLALDLLSGINASRARDAAATALRSYLEDSRKGEHGLAQSLALVVARGKEASGLDLAERWMGTAPEKYDRIDVAIALARRGRAAGFKLAVARAASDLLDMRRADRFRKCIADAPSRAHADRWISWAEDAESRYAWNDATQKWEKSK